MAHDQVFSSKPAGQKVPGREANKSQRGRYMDMLSYVSSTENLSEKLLSHTFNVQPLQDI